MLRFVDRTATPAGERAGASGSGDHDRHVVEAVEPTEIEVAEAVAAERRAAPAARPPAGRAPRARRAGSRSRAARRTARRSTASNVAKPPCIGSRHARVGLPVGVAHDRADQIRRAAALSVVALVDPVPGEVRRATTDGTPARRRRRSASGGASATTSRASCSRSSAASRATRSRKVAIELRRAADRARLRRGAGCRSGRRRCRTRPRRT